MDNIFDSWKRDKQAHVRYISPRIDIQHLPQSEYLENIYRGLFSKNSPYGNMQRKFQFPPTVSRLMDAINNLFNHEHFNYKVNDRIFSFTRHVEIYKTERGIYFTPLPLMDGMDCCLCVFYIYDRSLKLQGHVRPVLTPIGKLEELSKAVMCDSDMEVILPYFLVSKPRSLIAEPKDLVWKEPQAYRYYRSTYSPVIFTDRQLINQIANGTAKVIYTHKPTFINLLSDYIENEHAGNVVNIFTYDCFSKCEIVDGVIQHPTLQSVCVKPIVVKTRVVSNIFLFYLKSILDKIVGVFR